MFFCPPHGGADRRRRDATGHCPSDRLTPTTPFKKRVSRYANFVCSPVVRPSVVCLMSGDVAMATLVNAFYSPLRSSVVVRPLCLLTTKVKYFPRRPSLARPRVRPARVPVVWAPIMSGREREGEREGGRDRKRSGGVVLQVRLLRPVFQPLVNGRRRRRRRGGGRDGERPSSSSSASALCH